MSENYLQMGVVAAMSSLLAAAATVMGFKPRLKQVEDAVKEKLDKEVFEEVKAHINTKFDGVEQRFISQGREIGIIQKGVDKLLERRDKGRE